tara:strand:+ start:656 stop:856 length:201 start_codon:yes stop_codon:yes gene_type:complete
MEQAMAHLDGLPEVAEVVLAPPQVLEALEGVVLAQLVAAQVQQQQPILEVGEEALIQAQEEVVDQV